uniref:Slc4a-3 n=1 Tax=Schmidtea mediterranea TaxID=79327 RepID=A0A0H3YIX5_SCHMD|nr:slc4a-3 [Schmidtea mediterranea]
MFTKRKFAKNVKHKNVNFESYSVINSDSLLQEDCVPGFYFGSAGSISHGTSNPPLPWHSNKTDRSGSGYSHEEIDKIIAPSDRFENLISDNNADERKPEIFVPIDSHHFDEEDYRNHRHRVYPHMHQPLKSMEPHVLRKIKEKIRDNKKAQLKAATAGVPTSVPQLLAASIDSRVLISSGNSGGVVSGPVLGVIRPDDQPIDAEVIAPSAEQIIEIGKYNEPAVIPTIQGRKKRKRKRRRSKKQEPFQPTLGKLSEESSSPINSANEVDLFCGDIDDFEDDFDEEGDEIVGSEHGGMELEELCAVVNIDKAIDDVSMDTLGINYLPVSEEPQIKLIPFLEEISSSDQPIGFLDMTLQTKATRKHSLPVFIDAGHPEEKVDIISSHSSTDLIRCRTPYKRLHFDKPIDYSDDVRPHLINDVVEPSLEPYASDNISDGLKSTSSSQVRLSSTTHLHADLNHSGLTQVASTSALTGESCLKLSNCNFQVGSIDSVSVSKQNVFNLQSIIPIDRSISETPESSHGRSKQSPHHYHHHHHHHHHHKEHYNKRDLEKRTFSGQDMRSLWQTKDQVEMDEHQSMLGDAIIDGMRSHRCYDMPAFNRTRIRNKYLHMNNEKKPIQRSRSESHSQTTAQKIDSVKENIIKCTTCTEDNFQTPDYSKSQQDLIFQTNVCQNECNCTDVLYDDPLPLFVELDILKPSMYWREASRWVKYEQCYNEFSETFGRAHNSPLKFTAFTQFRVQMEDALFLPHVETKSLSDAINQFVEQLLVAQLFTEIREAQCVKEVLQFKHIHAGEKFTVDIDDPTVVSNEFTPVSDCTMNTISHKNDPCNELNLRVINTTPGNLNNVLSSNMFFASASKIKNSTENSGPKIEPSVGFKYGQHSNFPSMIKMLKNSIPIRRHVKSYKSDLIGHLPNNTEGVTVQVGELPALKKPFLGIIRFKTPLLMEKVSELNLPIRFMIVCLGPVGRVKYEELGRVIATMMINKDFRRMIYRATDKYEIIEGLYKYLDTCFVLSYSGPHPARNIHTMVDHINDFSKLQCNVTPLRTSNKETETLVHNATTKYTSYKYHAINSDEETAQLLKHEDGIKHSASVNWADEQHSQLIRRIDHQKSRDLNFDGDHQISCKKLEYDDDKTASSCNKSDAFLVNMVFTDKLDEYDSSTKLKKIPLVNASVFDCVTFFLFRLLKLDLISFQQRFLSDFYDGMKKDNIVIVLCGLLYLYFVCLSPALTFGALLGELVSDKFSVQLVLASQGALLILFSLLGGNPLLVIGITGPMFLMESVIGKMAVNFDIPILIYRFIVAMYCSLIGLISLAINITWIMQKVRRSVEECFNAFVGLYFIFKSILTILRIFTIPDPYLFATNVSSLELNSTEIINKSHYLYMNRIPIGLASLVMAYSMYQICIALNGVKRGRFFTRKRLIETIERISQAMIRKMIDYFNVAIGILVLSMVNLLFLNMLGVSLPTLKAEGNNTDWIKLPHLMEYTPSIPVTAHMIAFLLAFALLSLAFTETAIAGITVTRQDRKLTKPNLFAQDQFLCLCVIPLISGLFGWPFVSGAAVRSSSHVIAMTKWDQKVIPGVRHKILGVVEQRLTLLIVGGLVLATVLVEPLLNYIPTSAMLGMFLYMGVMGIRDLVVTRRLIAMFKRQKHWKDHEYLRDIPPPVLKAFEILQLGMIILMFSMNCITEFAGVSWCSFLIPALLLLFAVCREIVLPRIVWFKNHLDKLDPRHVIHIANVCLFREFDLRSTSEKSPVAINRPISANSNIQVSNIVSYQDSQSDIEDSFDTSGNEMSSCTSSDQDS